MFGLGVTLAVYGLALSLAVVSIFGTGCRRSMRHEPAASPVHIPIPETIVGVELGDPIPGLTAVQLLRFDEGEQAFIHAYEEAAGLGPTFNMISCFTCHDEPMPGGSSGFISVTMFGRVDQNGAFDPLIELGGPQFHRYALSEECREVIPPQANVLAKRITTPLFGAGLIEAIPDETILALADPQDADGDGISGRVHIVFDEAEQRRRVGRFGWKAQMATLTTFSAAALLNESGITNRLFPEESAPNGDRARAAECDVVPDLEEPPDESGVSAFDRMADFQRFLAPPSPEGIVDHEGALVFERIGCAVCHRPVLHTGPSEVEALARKPAYLYSDLLLHDMGSLGDGIVQGDALGSEFRTAPLWGLRLRLSLLHDGRASEEGDRVHEAIVAHDGEGAAARKQYGELDDEDRRALLRFLGSI